MIHFKQLTKPLLLISLPLMSLVYQPLASAHTQPTPSKESMKSREATIKLSVQKIINEGNKKTIFIKLTDIKTNKPIRLADLSEVHTQKIHLLIIDDSLSDYSHVHPFEAKEPGVYYFSWQPTKKEANYRIWAELVPLQTKQQEYVIADLYRSKSSLTAIIPKLSMVSIVDGYQFKLSFEQSTLQKGKALMGKIEISDAQGKAVHSLEPLMGAYGHIVGFSDDFNSVIHIHPMGTEPKKISDRGGPELAFHIEPKKAGFIKLFAQVKINGKEYIAPFGLIVQDKPKSS